MREYVQRTQPNSHEQKKSTLNPSSLLLRRPGSLLNQLLKPRKFFHHLHHLLNLTQLPPQLLNLLLRPLVCMELLHRLCHQGIFQRN